MILPFEVDPARQVVTIQPSALIHAFDVRHTLEALIEIRDGAPASRAPYSTPGGGRDHDGGHDM